MAMELESCALLLTLINFVNCQQLNHCAIKNNVHWYHSTLDEQVLEGSINVLGIYISHNVCV